MTTRYPIVNINGRPSELPVGDQIFGVVPAIGDWQSYTPTISGLGAGGVASANGRYRFVGDSCEVQVTYTKDATAGSGVAIVYASLPPNVPFDTTKTAYAGLSTGFTAFGGGTVMTGTFISPAGLYACKADGNAMLGQSVIANAIFYMAGTYPVVGRSAGTVATEARTFRLCEKYTMTHVLVRPSQLGEYRASYYSGNGSFTVNAPNVAPSQASGFLSTGTASYGFSDGAGNCAKFEVFIGRNKRWQVEAYVNSDRAGAAVLDALLYSTTSVGSLVGYDPSTGVLTVSKLFNAAATSYQYPARTIDANALSSFFFDILISDQNCTADLQAIVACKYRSSASQVMPNASDTVFLFPTKDYDTHNAYNPSTGIFTAPVDGIYEIKFSSLTQAAGWAQGSAFEIGAYNPTTGGVDRTLRHQIDSAGVSQFVGVGGSIMVKMNAGQTTYVYYRQDTGGTLSMHASAQYNHMSITRIGSYT